MSPFDTPNFQNSKYLKIPPLMNFSLSINLDASSPHIGWNGTILELQLGV
jgi:hypothetical protein